MNNFTLTQMEYVLAVNKHGHFAKAAAACHVTQPTLSMQIQKLEESLGVVIFDRSKKPILLTEVGRKIVLQMQTIVFESRKLDLIVEQSKNDKLSGRLVVGVIPTLAPYVLPNLLPVLEKNHQEVELKILELQTSSIVAALGEDAIDVGLMATPLRIPSLNEHPLFYEIFYALCHKGHRLDKGRKLKMTDLEADGLWLLEEGHCLRNQVLDICAIKKKSDKPFKFQFESGSIETLKNLVESYGGYTLVPELATKSLGRKSILVPFERPIPAREVGLVYRRDHYKLNLIEALAESIIKALPDDVRRRRMKDIEITPID